MKPTKHILLAIAMLLCSIDAKAEIVASGNWGNSNLTYILDDDGELVIEGTGAMPNYRHYSLMPWSDYIASVKTVTIKHGVASIGRCAFQNCNNLTSVTIPESVTSIGNNAFEYCSSLTSITLPEGVTSIGSGAFRGCGSLTSIAVPENVTSIGYEAFRGCASLRFVTIPENSKLTSIDWYVFYECSNLTSITIPESVTSIGIGVFVYCSLVSVNVAEENTIYDSRNNCNAIIETSSNTLIAGGPSTIIPESVTSIGQYAFLGCSGLTSIAIPESVTSIGDGAFWWCSNLASIAIPESVTSIESNAFKGCSSLTSMVVAKGNKVYDSRNNCNAIIETGSNTLIAGCASTVISSSVTSIGSSAFEDCKSLTSLNIPESVTEISSYAFKGCSSLTSITIPESVTSIWTYAFSGCSSLTSIVVAEGNTVYNSRDNCNAIIETSSNTLIVGCASTVIPSNVTSIGSSAFEDCSTLVTITIPESVTSIESSAFYNCSGLTSITCKAVTPPTIASSTFSGVDKSIPIYVPASSVEAYKAADHWEEFTNIQKMRDVLSSGTCGKNLTWVLYADGELVVEGTGDMYDYTVNVRPWISYLDLIKRIVVRDGVTSIGDYAFSCCRNSLTSVDLGRTIVSIGDAAFSDNYYLESINIPESVRTIGIFAFSTCALTDVTIPEGVTEIQQSTFENCELLVSVNIPESVTSIGGLVFQNCYSLTSITIPMKVTEIGEEVFLGCSSLTSIVVASENTSYDSRNNCNAIIETCSNTLIVGCASTIIPEGITSIGDNAFYNCDGLTSVSIPESVAEIGKKAFYDCNGLTSITCKSWSPPTIDGFYTFYNVSKSIPVYVPAGTAEAYKTANNWSGSGFTNIVEMIDFGTCGENLTWTLYPDGELVIEGTGAMPNYDYSYLVPWGYSYSDAIKKVTIKEGVTSIGDNAFSGCCSLASVTIPASVTSVGVEAFYGCSSLTSITIPESVTRIEKSTFSGCSNLSSITLPKSVTSIGNQAFYDCSSLTSITIPEGVSEIGESAFEYCRSLTSMVVAEGNTVYDSRNNCNAIIETNTNTLTHGCSATIIPEGVISIGSSAFRYCSNLASINIPESVTSIGDAAFYYCSSLASITLPSSVTSIEKFSFYGCSSLTSIAIPEGVTTIEYCAFSYCSSLTSITIPESVTSVGKWAFSSCSGLTSMEVAEGNTVYDSRNNCNAIIETSSNALIAGCASTVIPSSVTSIGLAAFYGNSDHTSITIPESVTSIGDQALSLCSSLTSITCKATTPPTIGGSQAFYEVDKSIPVYVPAGSVEAYQSAAYWSEFTNYQPLSSDLASGTCGDNLTWRLTEEYELIIEGTGDMYDYSLETTPWYEYRESIQTITLSEGVTSIGEYAFEECSGLALIYIPNGIRRIGECAFLNCDGLTAVHISSMEAWCNIDFDGYFATPLYYARNLYLNGDLVTEVNIPNTLESVKDYTFYNCSALASVTIPEGITEIGSYAFYYCRSLTSVIVPEGVTVLESYTFQYCSSLESLSLPNSLQKISWSAISHCDALKTIILPKNVHAIESYAFDYTGLTSVIIPEGVSKISYATFSHCSSLASISIPSSVSLIEELSLECCESLASITCHAVIPPAIGASNTFDGVDKSIPVYVPAGSVQAYKAAEYWSEFTNIQAISSDVASGTCGDNLTWRLTEEYELIIEGTGEMYDGSSWEGYEEAVKSITIGEGVTSIGDICFWNFSNLEVLTIPGSLTKIGGNPFYGCTELYTILLKSENPVYDIYDGNVVEKNSGTVVIGCRHVPAYSNVTKVGDFAYCGRGLSSIVIPESITSIGYAAFSENEDMTSITIPESVTSIGDHAFANCQKLTSVNIPEGVTKIGDWTFLQCYSLTSIEIPSSVTELGNLAFGLCESVTSITCMATNPPAAGNSFQGIDKSIPVYVPAGSVAAYKVANDWSEFTNILPIGEPEPATVTITINQYGSGTYSSEYALDFSEVMLLKAYVATGYNHLTGEVTLLRVHTAEAGTGLLVKGIPGMSYKVPILESTADHTLNMLVATLEKTKVNGHSDDGVYANYKYTVVKEQSPEPLFYQFADGASLSAGKAYLQIPVAWLPATGQRALRYRFDEGETTDIEETTANGGQSMVIYDLMGRRVLSPKKGEIYIINNKKVVY